ncbi:MAG: HNH endonuclease, partial [Rhodococcus sp.]|nr:HNH endonuclease [Rhodococcus sp. (in: high G+C Gram-positive bacteria)]
MFDDGVGSSGTAALLSGAESDCALIDLIADLHARESMLAERKLAAIAEFFERRSADHTDSGAWTST